MLLFETVDEDGKRNLDHVIDAFEVADGGNAALAGAHANRDLADASAVTLSDLNSFGLGEVKGVVIGKFFKEPSIHGAISRRWVGQGSSR